jgi:3-oxoacyl-[acyl-carrier-protein] synthase I
LINAATLQALQRAGRLLTEDNSDGVIPGEAAACLLLHAYEKRAWAHVSGLGLAHEPGLPTNDVPLRGDGVVAAAHAALGEVGLGLHDIDVRVSDAAGESYHFKEQVLLMSRLLRQRKEGFPLLLCATQLGDTGAAAGLVGIISAIEDVQRGFAPGRRAIAFAGASDGRRGAAVLEIEKR